MTDYALPEYASPRPDLAELRRLLDVNRGRDFHALPWHAWDRGIGYELHVGATCRDEMEPRGYCEEVNNGFRETFGAPEAELIVAAVNALPALLDAAAERDALAADADKWQRAALTLQGDRDALTDERDSLSWQVEALRAERDARSSERDGLAAKVERVRALHRESNFPSQAGTCNECDGWYPCETTRALDEEPQP